MRFRTHTDPALRRKIFAVRAFFVVAAIALILGGAAMNGSISPITPSRTSHLSAEPVFWNQSPGLFLLLAASQILVLLMISVPLSLLVEGFIERRHKKRQYPHQ